MDESISIPIINNGLVYLLDSLLRYSYSDLSLEERRTLTRAILTLQKSVGMPNAGKVLLTLSMKSMEDSTSGTPIS
jgi:hypothetical protein